MKEKILALLLIQFAGMRKDGLTHLARSLALQATTEDEAKALVEKLSKESVEDFIKDFRAVVDREVSDGNKSFKSNLEKKYDFVEKKEPAKGGDGKEKETDPDDIASIIKKEMEALFTPLKQEIEGFKAQNTTKTRLQTLEEKLKECKDETFKTQTLKDFSRMTFESEEAFTEYLTEKETDIATANQNHANLVMGGSTRPFVGGGKPDGKEASKEEVDAVVEKLDL